ncbi:Memo-like family protein [Babesia bovis T2Bo]|uniref:Uncharacterized protein n=1 Tax=Babesia bovis TaxID=5865 RepID=S6C8N6_BABBO|nr:Memo-like family protein [Babesia bovis T2Bo]EDO06391.2 Memo-like family protein [Babesia bovis T2Bo]BAN64930.1 conserved hypothetical protein [Babesia bovis]
MRRSIHAGSWYSNDAEILTEQIDQALSQAVEPFGSALKYIISPHAGYAYSLKTAGMSYGIIDTKKVNTVFILGPSHHLPLKGCAVDVSSTLQTPFGELQVDNDITTELLKGKCFKELSKRNSEEEHSIEMQLPILHYVANKSNADHIKVVPIVVGYMLNEGLEDVGQALLPYFEKEDTIFVISSDFCHFGKRFGFTRTGFEDQDMPIWKAIESLDLDGVKLIVEHDLEGFLAYLRKTKNTICGRHPIEVLLKLISMSQLKITSKMLSYTQSSKCSERSDSSVSYCSIAGMLSANAAEA